MMMRRCDMTCLSGALLLVGLLAATAVGCATVIPRTPGDLGSQADLSLEPPADLSLEPRWDFSPASHQDLAADLHPDLSLEPGTDLAVWPNVDLSSTTDAATAPDAAVVCTPAWSCGGWSTCSCSNTQTRSCVDLNGCGTSVGKPALSQSCNHCGNGTCDCSETNATCTQDCPTSCTPSWSCGGWSTCSCSNTQTRTCSDAHSCGTSVGEPAASQSCTHCGNGTCDCSETNATCPADCPGCPNGNGLYCGGHGVGGTTGTLYQCTNGSLSVSKVCGVSCTSEPAGTNDVCAPCPAGNGLYCGGHGIGGSTGTLYECADGLISVSSVCAHGCISEPAGQDDACS